MHTITQLTPTTRFTRRLPVFKATYTDGDHIYGESLAGDPITAYHGAVLTALRMHEVNARLHRQAR